MVQRYDVGVLATAPEGAFVTYEDYAALETLFRRVLFDNYKIDMPDELCADLKANGFHGFEGDFDV